MAWAKRAPVHWADGGRIREVMYECPPLSPHDIAGNMRYITVNSYSNYEYE